MNQATFEAENISELFTVGVPMGYGIGYINKYAFDLIINGIQGK